MATEVQHMDVDPQPTAAQRVWQVPEIVIQIFSYLAREQVDLLALSMVSKGLRPIALHWLVRDLDIPLTRADDIIDFFDGNEHLLESVRTVRVRDDEAVRRCSYRPHSRPRFLPEPRRARYDDGGSSPMDADCGIELLEEEHCSLPRLFGLWQAGRTAANPLVDITAGISTIFDWNASLEDGVPPAESVSALRIISDHKEFPRSVQHQADRSAYRQDCQMRWSQLADTVERVPQWFRPPPKRWLPVFQYEDCKTAIGEDSDDEGDDYDYDRLDTEFWQKLPAAATTHKLQVRIRTEGEDANTVIPLLQAQWPNLRVLDLYITFDTLYDTEDQALMDIVGSFVGRHAQLEELTLEASYLFQFPSVTQTFPNLVKCALGWHDSEQHAAFLLRHARTLKDITVPVRWAGSHDALSLALQALGPVRFPQLRIIRASPAFIADMFTNGWAPQLAHVEVRPPLGLATLQVQSWAREDSGGAATVTCLDLELSFEEIVRLTANVGAVITPERFPQLVELAITCTRPFDKEPIDAEHEGAHIVKHLLLALKGLPKLRAVRAEHSLAQPFSVGRSLFLRREAVPPALEYFTWHAPAFNETQYFRATATTADDEDSLVSEPRAMVRLQRLPPSFRVQITPEGEWVQPTNLRHANILFDHTVSPPRLP